MSVSAGVSELRGQLAAVIAALDPDGVPLADSAALWAEFDALERLSSGAKALLAARVAESRAWRDAGHRGAAEHLAAVAGTWVGTAQALIQSSKWLAELPVVAAAVREGALSSAQTAMIADAASEDPESQTRLVGVASRASLRELRDECGRVKAAADPDPESRHARHHRNRRLRTFTDLEGRWHLRGRGPADAGARLLAALEPIIDERFAEAKVTGIHEPREAYAFDALIDLARRATTDTPDSRPPARKRPGHLTLVRVDLAALVRGAVADGELCEITGLGPIPVSVARQILGDSILKLVITKGVDVANLTHLGRGPTAAQRLALLWSSPTCAVEGCNAVRYQRDHRIPWTETKHTRLDELDALCKQHHDRKTRDNWELVPGKGKRSFVPPTDPRHPRYAREAGRPPPEPA